MLYSVKNDLEIKLFEPVKDSVDLIHAYDVAKTQLL